MTIIEGFRIATDTARKELDKSAHNNETNATLFKEDLLKIAKTTMSSKILPSA